MHAALLEPHHDAWLDGERHRRLSRRNVDAQAVASSTTPARGSLVAVGTPDKRIVFTSDEASPQAGDWLPLPTSGRFQLRLRLYDTPIATQAGETRPESLPRIERLDCP